MCLDGMAAESFWNSKYVKTIWVHTWAKYLTYILNGYTTKVELFSSFHIAGILDCLLNKFVSWSQFEVKIKVKIGALKGKYPSLNRINSIQ